MINLKKYELFKNFGDDQLEKISKNVISKSLSENEVIFKEGDKGDAIYLIDSGIVAIKRKLDEKDETEKTLAVIEEGDFFGEMALFDDKPRSAGAYSVTKVNLNIIEKEKFLQILHEDSKVAVSNLLGINKVLSARLRVSNQNFITTFEVGQIMATATNLLDMFNKTLDQICYAINNEEVVLFALYNEYLEDLRILTKQGGLSDNIKENEIDIKDPLFQKILTDKNEMYIDSEEDINKYSSSLTKIGDFKSVLLIPIFRNEKFLGLLLVGSFSQYKAFSQSDKLLVQTIASQVASVIEALKYKEEEENRKRLQLKRFSY